MGTGCTKCCGKVQDWCRDSCGCCPCKCCKTAVVEVKAQPKIEFKVEKKDIPFGCITLHAGIRATDNTYTSPVLEVHTWRESKVRMATNEFTMTQRVALGGMQTERDNADRHLGPSRGTEQQREENDAELTVIPVESILSMKYSSEVKKGQTEFKHVRLSTPPPFVRRSCCQRVCQWCETFWCCNNSKTQVHTKPEQIITTISNREAERKILITIEYIRYSNIHTPSHVRVLSVPDQSAFYKEHIHSDTLQLYLLNNHEFEKANFDAKQMQASTICRLVTQLKSMIGHYPDEPTLNQIINRQGILTIGDPLQETIQPLDGPRKANNSSWEAAVPFPAINDRP